MIVKFRIRRDTAANWTTANPVLALGEPGLETDTRRTKYGDGTTAWNSLPYSRGAVAWGQITGTLSDQTDLQTALNGKEPTIAAGTTGQYWRGDKSWQPLDKAAVGLGNLSNTVTGTGNVVLSSSPTITGTLTLSGDTLRIATERTPASASATGTKGDICWDADFVYVCVSANTWKRAALSTW